ncbi:GEVED domain-containing protein [Paucihalobacter sp.]|uniref:Ig-like domain-containing protein n=1 Tax=Paucihalobacter sp. TaxID=2850405 RepID=UPI003D1619D2
MTKITITKLRPKLLFITHTFKNLNKVASTLPVFLLVMMVPFLGFGQGATCATATSITIDGACTSGTISATPQTAPNINNVGCPIGTFRRQGWYTFTVTDGPRDVTITGQSGNRNLFLQLISSTASCTGLTQIECANNDTNNNSGQTEVIQSTLGNGVYYIKVVNVGNNNNMTLNSLCISSTPSNNDCNNATSLTVNPDTNCAVSTSETTTGATQSIPGIICNGFTGAADDDVWFSFEATETNHDITVTPGTLNDAVIELRSGACNGTNIACADDTDGADIEVINASGLTVGDTYYVRVYSWGANGNQGTFDICVTSPGIVYCEPNSDDPAFTFIDDIQFLGTLNDVSNNNSGFAAGYQDWTGLPNAVQAQGEGMNIFFNCNRGSRVKAWVDWNQNGSFEDAGELVYDTDDVTTTSATFGVIIPMGTPPGEYRIRIRNNTYIDGPFFLNYNFNSCEDFPNYFNEFWDGEAEDYLFTVIENCDARITSVTDGENCGPGTVTLSATSNLGGASFNWYDSETGGSLLANTLTGTYTTPALTTTTTYYVTAQNGCQTLVRVPVKAIINPVSDVTFDPPTLEACGEDSAITINASGDTEIVYLVDEDFESGTLGVFQNELGYANGAPYDIDTQWTNQTSAYVPNNTLVWFPAISSGFGSNNFVMSTSDVNPPAAPGPPGTTRVEQFLQLSTVVDATDVTNLTLTFDMYYSVFGDFVDVQVNDGGGWNTVNTYNASVGIGTRFAPQNIDLSAYDNANNLSFRIRFMSGWGDGVAVDNIKLFGERPVVPAFTWTSLPAIDAFLDAGFTTPYIAGTPAGTVYIRPTLDQLELNSFDIAADITLSNGCPISEGITITNNTKVWHGDLNNSVDWNDHDNWLPYGVPTEDNCVIITNYFDCLIPDNSGPLPPVFYEAEAKSLSIKNGGYLDILSSNNLTVTEDINMEAMATLNIRNGANVVQIDDVPNTGAGGADLFRSTNIRRLDYVYWSSPVANFNVTDVSPNTNPSLMYEWIPTVVGNGAGNYGEWATASGIMTAGKGYIIRGPNTFPNTAQEYIANFNGRLNNGLINQTITRGTYIGGNYPGAGNTDATSLDDNWNLLGNPYPSAIDAAAFTSANTNVNGTIYLWTHGTDILGSPSNVDPFYGDFAYNYTIADYLAYNTTGANPPGFDGNIGAGQGFFVLKEDVGSTSQNVTFNNSMRVKNNNDQFFRNTEVLEKHRIWLDLLEPTGNVNTTLIGYLPEATNEKDRLFDAYIINNTAQTIYSRIANENMSIQGRSLPFLDTDIVPLGVIVSGSGVHTIAINQIDGLFAHDQNIYLEDLELGVIHDLKQAPYFFTPENTGRFNNRFQLRYTNETLSVNGASAATISIYKNDNEVRVLSPSQNISKVTIHDVLGRMIGKHSNINQTEFKFNAQHQSNGTYIVTVELTNGLVTTKKIMF